MARDFAMDFSRYAGQTRPWTVRDAVMLAAVERQAEAELDRAERKASARRSGQRAARPRLLTPPTSSPQPRPPSR
jgi:hypothetical protein